MALYFWIDVTNTTAKALYGDLTAICNRAAASASSSTSGSTPSTTLRTSAKTDTTIATSSINTSSSLLPTPSPQASSSTGSDAASTTDSESSGSSSQLSTGAAVGIGVGAAFLFMILALGLFLLWRRKRKRQRTAPNSENDENKTAEVSGKPVVDAELPGSSPQHELYGESTHAPEMDSHTRISNSNGPIIPMKEAQNANVVYELPADQSSANVQGK